MNKTRFSAVLASIIFVLGLFGSCNSQFGMMPLNGDKVNISVELSSIDGSLDGSLGAIPSDAVLSSKSRTILPSISESSWNQFNYMLSAQTSKDGTSLGSSADLFTEKKTYADLKAGISLERQYYKFTLSAYTKTDEKKVMEGTTDIIDLSVSGKKVPFKMKPLTGGTGEVEITITVPDSVKEVTLGLSTESSFGNQGTPQKTETWDIYSSDQSLRTKKFTYSTRPSGTEQYVYVKMFDAQGLLVYAASESIIVVGGLTSKGEIKVTADKLHVYDAAITLKKDGAVWTNSGKELLLVQGGKKYKLVDSNNNGTFNASEIPEGNYSVYVRDAGDTTTGTDTGLKYNAAAQSLVGKDALNFITVQIPDLPGIDLTPTLPMPNAIPGEEDDEILIVDGSDEPIEFTVEPKPGYEPGDDGIKINGKEIIDEDGNIVPENDSNGDPNDGGQVEFTPSELTDTRNPISSSGAKPTVYTLTFKLDEGATWSTGGSEDKTVTYTVEDHTNAFPTETDINAPVGYEFNGWKLQGGDSAFTLVSDTTGNYTLYPLWITGSTATYKVKTITEKADGTNEETVVEKTAATNSPITISADKTKYKIGTGDEIDASKSGFDVVVSSTTPPTITKSTTVITIKYTRKNVTLTIIGNDGTIDGQTQVTRTGKFGTAVASVPDPVHNNPKADYYVFKGWNSDNGTIPSIFPNPDDEGVVTTYTAKWEKRYADYKVKYLFEKTSYAADASDDDKYQTDEAWPVETVSKVLVNSVVSGNTYVNTNKTIPSGFELNTTADQKSVSQDDSTLITVKFNRKMITLKYYLSDSPRGGVWSDDQTSTARTRTGKYGTTVTQLPNVTTDLDYYTADGWKLDNGTSVTLPATFPTENTNYTHFWTQHSANYTITYKQKIGETTATWTPPSDAGYKTQDKGSIGQMTGKTISDFTAPTGFDTTEVVDMTLTNDASTNKITVTFTAKTITYTYVADGGAWDTSITTKQVSGPYSTAVTVPASPTKTDCTFAGWDYNATTFELNNGVVTRTIKAKWNSSVGVTVTWSGDVAITSDASSQTLTAVPPYSGTWTYEWYDDDIHGKSTNSVGTGITFDYSTLGKGKHTITLEATESGTTLSTTIDITVN